MTFVSRSTLIISGLAITARVGMAQVFWNSDFDSNFPFCHQTGITQFNPPAPPTIRAAVVDVGPPQNNVLQVSVDASNQIQSSWRAQWVLNLCEAPNVTYDPTNTFLQFDVLVTALGPVHVRLDYIYPGSRMLDTDVQPAVTNAFQTFLLPLTAFAETYFPPTNAYPQFPTGIEFGIRGDPANPETTWASASNNVFMVDNIIYIIAPPLSITAASGTLSISWPTNAPGFILQQSTSTSFKSSDWTDVTETPAVGNGMNQVGMPADKDQSFYRLVWR